jgi:hypothetical protein
MGSHAQGRDIKQQINKSLLKIKASLIEQTELLGKQKYKALNTIQRQKHENLMLGKGNYLNDGIGRLNSTSMQLLDLTFVPSGYVGVKNNLVQIIIQPILFFLETSQRGTSRDKPGDIILDLHLKIPLPFHKWPKFSLQNFDAIFNSFLNGHIERQGLFFQLDTHFGDTILFARASPISVWHPDMVSAVAMKAASFTNLF